MYVCMYVCVGDRVRNINFSCIDLKCWNFGILVKSCIGMGVIYRLTPLISGFVDISVVYSFLKNDFVTARADWVEKEEVKEVSQQWEDDWDDDDVNDDFSLQLRKELESNAEKK